MKTITWLHFNFCLQSFAFKNLRAEGQSLRRIQSLIYIKNFYLSQQLGFDFDFPASIYMGHQVNNNYVLMTSHFFCLTESKIQKISYCKHSLLIFQNQRRFTWMKSSSPIMMKRLRKKLSFVFTLCKRKQCFTLLNCANLLLSKLSSHSLYFQVLN